MGYLICDKCGGYYELQEGESPEDFDNNCECGGNLKYAETIAKIEPKGKKSSNYMCVDIKCKFAGLKYEEGRCPECGKQLHEVDSTEAIRIADSKSRYSNNPNKPIEDKQRPQKDLKTKFTDGLQGGNKQNSSGKSNLRVGVCCLGLIIILIIGGVLFANQTTAQKTYSGQSLTFNYPADWELNPNADSSSNADLTLGTGHSAAGATYNAGVDIISINEYAAGPPAIPANMDSVIQDMRQGMSGTYDKKEITVAGENGVEYTETDTGELGGKHVDVYFSKGNNLYDIHMTSTDFDTDKTGFEMIVNTIKVQ